MAAGTDFYQDETRGEFSGNILAPLSALFPASLAPGFCGRPPLESRWLLTVRSLRDGAVGYLFRTEPEVVRQLKELFEDLYKGFPRDARYPGIYNEGHGGGLPMVCLSVIGEGRVSVWLRTKIADETDGTEHNVAADRQRD